MASIKPYGYVVLLLAIVLAMPSCQRTTVSQTNTYTPQHTAPITTTTVATTAKTNDVSKSGLTEVPDVADLDIDASRKISGAASVRGYNVSVEDVKKLAVYNALQTYNADVLVGASYENTATVTGNERTISVSVQGWAGKYAKAKPIDKNALAVFQYYASLFYNTSDTVVIHLEGENRPTKTESTKKQSVAKEPVKQDRDVPVAKKETIPEHRVGDVPPVTPSLVDTTIAEGNTKAATTDNSQQATNNTPAAAEEKKAEAATPPPTKESEKAKEKITPPPAKSQATGTVDFKIKLMASKVKIGKDKDARLAALPDYEVEESDFYRYYTGHFTTLKEAQGYLPDVQKKGFPQAYVVAFKNGVSVPLSTK